MKQVLSQSPPELLSSSIILEALVCIRSIASDSRQSVIVRGGMKLMHLLHLMPSILSQSVEYILKKLSGNVAVS